MFSTACISCRILVHTLSRPTDYEHFIGGVVRFFPSYLLSSPFFSLYSRSRNSDSGPHSSAIRLYYPPRPSPPHLRFVPFAFLSREEDFNQPLLFPRRPASNSAYPRYIDAFQQLILSSKEPNKHVVRVAV